MTQLKFIFVAAFLMTSASQTFAEPFACTGISSKGIECGKEMRDAVTARFGREYPYPKYKLMVTSGHSIYKDGSSSGAAVVWLGSTFSQEPQAKSISMRHFATGKTTEARALELEKTAILNATRDLMEILGMDKEEQLKDEPRLVMRRCRTVQETQQSTSVESVCDYDNFGQTNCHNETKSEPTTVDKQVCD